MWLVMSYNELADKEDRHTKGLDSQEFDIAVDTVPKTKTP